MNMHAPITVQLWFTAQEMADAAEQKLLPGIPATKQGINDLARRENWSRYHALVRPRGGREGGGGFEYHIDILPLDIRLCYLTRFLGVSQSDMVAPVSTGADNLTECARLTRDVKMYIIKQADQFRRTLNMTALVADAYFADMFNQGRVPMPAWAAGVIDRLSARTLMRWRQMMNAQGSSILGHDPSLARKGKGLLETANNGRVKAFILAWIASNTALSAEIIRGYCKDEFGSEVADQHGVMKELPPVRTFQHFIKSLKTAEMVAITKITNPDKYRSTMKLVGTGSYGWVTEPNQLWMIDASPVDALCVDGRYSMYACIDIATRRLVITLSKTPRASAVGLLIRKATLKMGVAHTIKTDNGSDFVAVATKRLFDNLDIKPDVSHAYSPAEKGHVERVIKTFQHDVCPQLPGYIGHNVADRKAIEGRKSFAERLGADEYELFQVSLTAEQLQQHIDDWLEYVYHERAHGGLNKRTPNAVAATSMTPIRRVDERAMDALLMPAAGKNGLRVMTKQGISIENFYYICGTIMVGTDVFVRLDPMDMGKVYVYSADGQQFLDEAICPELSNIDRVAFVKAKKADAEAMVTARTKEIKADIRALQKGPSGIERTIRLAKQDVAERAATSANIIQMPKRDVEHSTPAIAAALNAVTLPKIGIKPKPLNKKAAELHEAIKREAENRKVAKVVHLDPDAGLSAAARRFKWAMDQEARIKAGVQLDAETAMQLVRFQASPEYQTIKDTMEDFGLEQALLMAR